MGGEAPGVEILSAGGDQPADPADLGLVQQTLVPGQTRYKSHVRQILD